MTVMPPFEAPFSVYVKDIIHVTPSNPTPNVILPLSTIDSDYDHDVPAYFVRVYNGRLDRELNPADVIREALSKALVYYYPLAGKLKRQQHGRVYVHCNAVVGVPFVVASATCKLSDVNHIDGVYVRNAKDLIFDFPPEDETGKYSLVLQVTTFLCGGFTIGFGLWHAICDGAGISQFFNTLTELASGMSEPSVMPAWERERLNGSFLKEPYQPAVDPAVATDSPYLPTTDLELQCFHVDNKSLRNLKFSLMKESRDPTLKESSFTTYEALGAYIWRSKCKALKLNVEGEALLWVGVGIRKVMRPPLPIGYYGNAYLAADHVMKVKDLLAGPLLNVVKHIKELKNQARSNIEFMRNRLSYLETIRRLEIHDETHQGGVTEIVDWRQLGAMQEVDFGWGKHVNCFPASKNMLNNLNQCFIVSPSYAQPSMGDGVRVFIILPTACTGTFKGELDALRDSHAMNKKFCKL